MDRGAGLVYKYMDRMWRTYVDVERIIGRSLKGIDNEMRKMQETNKIEIRTRTIGNRKGKAYWEELCSSIREAPIYVWFRYSLPM